MSEIVTTVLLMRDKEDENFVHLYYPGKSRSNYLCCIHTDNLYDLFGAFNHTELMNILKPGVMVPYTLGLTLQS